MNDDKDNSKEEAYLKRRAEMLRLSERHLRAEEDAAGWQAAGSDQRGIANHSVPEMLARLEGFQKDYTAFVQKVKVENLWETQWLDTDCEPAETFTYGTTIEATLTWGIAQRMVVQRLLEQIGL